MVWPRVTSKSSLLAAPWRLFSSSKVWWGCLKSVASKHFWTLSPTTTSATRKRKMASNPQPTWGPFTASSAWRRPPPTSLAIPSPSTALTSKWDSSLSVDLCNSSQCWHLESLTYLYLDLPPQVPRQALHWYHQQNKAVQRVSGQIRQKPIPLPTVWPGGTPTRICQVGESSFHTRALSLPNSIVFNSVFFAFLHGPFRLWTSVTTRLSKLRPTQCGCWL